MQIQKIHSNPVQAISQTNSVISRTQQFSKDTMTPPQTNRGCISTIIHRIGAFFRNLWTFIKCRLGYIKPKPHVDINLPPQKPPPEPKRNPSKSHIDPLSDSAKKKEPRPTRGKKGKAEAKKEQAPKPDSSEPQTDKKTIHRVDLGPIDLDKKEKEEGVFTTFFKTLRGKNKKEPKP